MYEKSILPLSPLRAHLCLRSSKSFLSIDVDINMWSRWILWWSIVSVHLCACILSRQPYYIFLRSRCWNKIISTQNNDLGISFLFLLNSVSCRSRVHADRFFCGLFSSWHSLLYPWSHGGVHCQDYPALILFIPNCCCCSGKCEKSLYTCVLGESDSRTDVWNSKCTVKGFIAWEWE